MSGNFDSVAEVYDSVFKRFVRDHYIEKRIQYIKKNFGSRKKILDAGCGTGLLTMHLLQAGFDVYGIDISQEMAKIAENRLPGRIVCACIKNIPFPAESFDGVICVATLHHLNHIEFRHALKEMVRVLKVGGRLLIWDHNRINPYWHWLMKRVPQDTGREKIFSAKIIIREMKSNGLSLIKHERKGFVPDFAPALSMPLFTFLEKGIENIPFLNYICAHEVILGEK
ncbi:MAG TPA: methyltransferase domain-containing protein [bacterium]|nr:methyltransferase domain-containing protein [bacterium]HOL34693.1 methyltransferase domain-containing protein [bacterium]HPP07549.1 methyltransferase domain-containing protein [bacterium]